MKKPMIASQEKKAQNSACVDASRASSGGIKSKERVEQHGEVFTPTWIVNDMLDMLPSRGEKSVWQVSEELPQKRFLEPACGEGAFLVEVLARKLNTVNEQRSKAQEDWEWHSALAVSSIYGIELLEDNAQRCTENLYEVYLDNYYSKFQDTKNPQTLSAIKFLISRNIMQGDALKYVRADGSPIVVSEFTPQVAEEGVRQLARKDFDFHQLSKTSDVQQELFASIQDEPGLIATFEPIKWRAIEFAKEVTLNG